MKVEKLPHELFLKTFEWVPRIAINVHVEDESGAVLLTQRAIEPKKGSWHYPGSFLLKNETIQNCIERVVTTELGAEIESGSELLGVFENLDADPRGHVVDVVYRVKLLGAMHATEETKALQFFHVLPEDISFHHDAVLKSLGF